MIGLLRSLRRERLSPRHWRDRELDKPLVEKWRIAAKHFSDRPAVRTLHREWSYREIEVISDRLASKIVSLCPPGGGVVGIHAGQTGEGIVAILAALKAGRPFVFLTPEDPPERRRLIAGLAEIACLLTDGTAPFPALENAPPAIHLDSPPERPDAAPMESIALPPPPPTASADLAIVFTSGMSGTPNGVKRSQRSQLHLVRHLVGRCDLGPEDRIAMIIPPSFGACLNDLFLALLTGATLYPFSLAREGGARLAEWLIAEKITYCHCVPSVFRTIARQGAGVTQRLTALRWFKLGGEPLFRSDVEAVSSHFPDTLRLLYSYGSTETGGTISDKVFDQPLSGTSSEPGVGRAIPGKDVFIAAADGTPLPPGEEGEIVVRSRFLSSGYFRDEAGTADRFQPVGDASGTVSYRTRDRGLLDASGELCHLGRLDRQVKWHGMRVNPAEIESRLSEHPGIAESALLFPANGSGMIAFLCGPSGASGDPPDLSELRVPLSRLFPRGIFPNRLIWLESLPRLSNGKIDREALKTLADESPTGAARGASLAPRNELERIIAGIWRKLLGHEGLGVYDDFFELGGDSLIALNFQADLTRQLGLNIPIAILLGEHPTVAHVAEQVRHATRMGFDESGSLSAMTPPFPPLVHLRVEGSARPIVFVPGGYGSEAEMMLFARISARLNPAHPLCGFLATHLYHLEPPPTSVEQIAAAYLSELQRIFPDRAPILVGNCIAGPVAHEMARQLENRLDAPVHPDLILIESASRRGWRRRQNPRPDSEDVSHRHPDFVQSYFELLDRFVPGTYRGAMHLLVSDTYQDPQDATLGWKNHVAEEIKLIPIPGDHHESLRRYRTELGDILSGIINAL